VNWHNGLADGLLSSDVFRDIAKKHWGSTDAADLTMFKGKALAAKMIQDYGYIKESLILCDATWPIYQVSSINLDIRSGTLESRIAAAITGRELDEATLLKIGERVFNLQRAVLLREGWGGRKGDTLLEHNHEEPLEEVYWSAECLVPGKNGRVDSRKGAVVAKEDFEKLKDDYYQLRGWDVASGLPARAKLEELGLHDLCEPLEQGGLLK
jgi:aldehyde:ferredoxin oxidoreductase